MSGIACLSSLLSIPDLVNMGFALFPRSPTRLEAFLFTSDSTYIEALLALRSAAQSDMVLLILNPVHSGLFMLPRSLVCMSSVLSVLDFVGTDPFLSSHLFAYSDFVLLVLDFTQLRALLFLHSLAHLGLSPLVPDPLHLSFLPPLRSSTHSRSSFSLFGTSCLDVSLPMLNLVQLNLLLTLRSFARLKSSISALDSVHVGLLLFPHSHACLDFAMPTLDFVQSDLSLASRSLT